MQHCWFVACYGFPGVRGYSAWLTVEFLHSLPTSLFLTLLLIKLLWLVVGAAAVVNAYVQGQRFNEHSLDSDGVTTFGALFLAHVFPLMLIMARGWCCGDCWGETSESPSYCPSFGGMLTVHRFTLADCLVPCLGPFGVMSTERNFFEGVFFSSQGYPCISEKVA